MDNGCILCDEHYGLVDILIPSVEGRQMFELKLSTLGLQINIFMLRKSFVHCTCSPVYLFRSGSPSKINVNSSLRIYRACLNSTGI